MSSVERHDIWSAVWNGLRAKDMAALKRPVSTAAGDADAVPGQREVLLFRRGGDLYAVPVENLRQIRATQRFCRIPGAVSVVPGVIDYQGQILGVHDLAAYLGRHADDHADSWVLVLEEGGDRLGLRADDVLDIRQVSKAACQPVPPSLGKRSDCFSGMLSDGTLLLRPARLFATAAFCHGR